MGGIWELRPTLAEVREVSLELLLMLIEDSGTGFSDRKLGQGQVFMYRFKCDALV